MKRIVAHLKHGISKLRLKQRMLLVYFLGCFLPLLCVYIYMYSATKNALLEQEYQNEINNLEVTVSSLESEMRLAEEFSEKLYYDKDKQKLGLRQYEGTLLVDYKNFKELYDYTNEYYPYISSVCIYVKDDSFIDNNCFKYITDTISEKNWYKNTLRNQGRPYWSYITNIQTGKKSLRLTKALYVNRAIAGVVSISLSDDVSTYVSDNSDDMMLLVFNGETLVQSNVEMEDYEVKSLLDRLNSNEEDIWITFGGERYMVTRSTVDLRFSDEYYNLITIKQYNDILALANKSSLGGLLPLLLGMLVSTVAILGLTRWFLKRINSFSEVMHAAASGEEIGENTEIERVHDEIWDLNNDLNQMIYDIRKLNDEAANEKIQKEQIYSRQKDVEFKMLATQINPHFLYNTLENIRMLARINKQPEIEDISVTLTRLLRRSLNVSRELVTLQWEMEMVEYYIRIQNYRFGDRIRASVSYDKNMASEFMIIPLVVQPFVENAYVHAMEDKEADGLITIRAEISDDMILYIEDNGHGMDEKTLYEITRYINDFDNLDRTHIGICNVNQRIKLKFGDAYGVDFDSTKDVGTKVKITLPLVPK
jgi:two-component system sensor histidine kinase YesM